MKLALAQISVEKDNVEANLDLILDCMVRAGKGGADLLVLPEMCTTGLNWSRSNESVKGVESALDSLVSRAVDGVIAFCGSFPEAVEGGHFSNTFYYYNSKGDLLGKYRKVHLFSLFGEDRRMFPGDKILTLETDFIRTGCSICYDLRFPELFRRCVLNGAELQILVAAFPHPRLSHWQSLIRARAIENQVYFVAVNQCGMEEMGQAGEISYFGHSMVVDPWGEVVFEAGEAPGLFFVEIDPGMVKQVREGLPALQDRRPDLY